MTNPDDNLAASLRGLREAESRSAAPARVEAAVMAAWDAAHPTATPARVTVASRIGSLAAAAVLALGLGALGEHLRSAQLVPPSAVAADAAQPVILVGEPLLDGEQVRLVRMRMPASALHALGVTASAAITDVDVDVIVGEDGVARALRLNP
jgi:2-methylaconitate cis-trans-isomerase PrpF